MFRFFIALLFAALPVFAQDDDCITYVPAHNVTSIVGTWASGSQKVVTGPGFAQPQNQSFIYPPVAGISFSFSEDNFYEVALYRFTSNGPQPSCITAVLNWHHGSFDFACNGSLVLTPFPDGYQQVEDPCAAVSNMIQPFDDVEIISSWQIFQDPQDGYKLHLFQEDGTPYAPQFQVSTTPNMLPTTNLLNVTAEAEAASKSKRMLRARSAGERAQAWTAGGLLVLVTSTVLVGAASALF